LRIKCHVWQNEVIIYCENGVNHENFKDSVRNEMKISVQKTEIVKLKADWVSFDSNHVTVAANKGHHKRIRREQHCYTIRKLLYINARRGVIVVD